MILINLSEGSSFCLLDHFRHLGITEAPFGIMCRVQGLDAVMVGPYDAANRVCIDLKYATPEEDLWDHLKTRIKDYGSLPR